MIWEEGDDPALVEVTEEARALEAVGIDSANVDAIEELESVDEDSNAKEVIEGTSSVGRGVASMSLVCAVVIPLDQEVVLGRMKVVDNDGIWPVEVPLIVKTKVGNVEDTPIGSMPEEVVMKLALPKDKVEKAVSIAEEDSSPEAATVDELLYTNDMFVGRRLPVVRAISVVRPAF